MKENLTYIKCFCKSCVYIYTFHRVFLFSNHPLWETPISMALFLVQGIPQLAMANRRCPSSAPGLVQTKTGWNPKSCHLHSGAPKVLCAGLKHPLYTCNHMYVCNHMHVCNHMYVCMYVCMHACMSVCMYVRT